MPSAARRVFHPAGRHHFNYPSVDASGNPATLVSSDITPASAAVLPTIHMVPNMVLLFFPQISSIMKSTNKTFSKQRRIP